MPKVNHLSNEDIRKRISEILAEYPAVGRINPSDFACDCSGCTVAVIATEYSWPVARAWDELQDLYYLLG